MIEIPGEEVGATEIGGRRYGTNSWWYVLLPDYLSSTNLTSTSAEALRGARLASSVLFDTAATTKTPTKQREGEETSSNSHAEALLRAIGDHPRLRKVSKEDVIGVLVTKVVSTHGLVASHSENLSYPTNSLQQSILRGHY